MKIEKIKFLLKEKKTKLESLKPNWSHELNNISIIDSYIDDINEMRARLGNFQIAGSHIYWRRGPAKLLMLKEPKTDNMSLYDWYCLNKLNTRPKLNNTHSGKINIPYEEYITGVCDIELYLYRDVNNQAVSVII